MKNKIRLRLLLYFAGYFLVFSLIISLIFFSLFSHHNMDIHKNDLENRAQQIARTLGKYISNEKRHGQHGMMGKGMGYSAYLQFLHDIAPTDVWIVDRNLNQITRGRGLPSLSYKDLPPGAEKVIITAMEGKAMFSKGFGAFLGQPSMTVAAPITLISGDIAGVVLLHEKIAHIRKVTTNGLVILLLSMGAAIIISFFVAHTLAGHFTRPLAKMKTAALKVSSGDYSAKTNVIQTDEIGELAAALDDMAAKLEAASREESKLEKMRRDFIANISHELRTPVTVIRGSLEALKDGVVSKPDLVGEYHRQMLTESIYLERLVADLLDLARLQNPDFAMEIQEVNLKEIAQDALRGMEQLAKAKEIALELNAIENDFSLEGDYGRLRQMLIIILDNAIKYSPRGSTVHLDLHPAVGGIALNIRDEGSGIPALELPHIFERFRKGQPGKDKGSTGLGLAIAKEIADRHRIIIDVQSKPGQGTEFIFFIPTKPK